MGNILRGLAQGFESFATNKPLGGIQDRDEIRRLQQALQQSGNLQSPEFQQLSALAPDVATKIGGIFGKIGIQRETEMFQTGRTVLGLLKAGNINDAAEKLAEHGERVIANGGDPKDTFEIAQDILGGRVGEAINKLELADQVAVSTKILTDPEVESRKGRPAGLVEFDKLVEIAQDPDSSELKRNAAKVKLGVIARKSTSAQERIAQDPDLASQVAEAEGLKSAAKETAKLKSQFKLKPQVEAAVTSAIAKANQTAKLAETGRSNEIAFNVYNTGMKGLIDGLAGTDTGPFIGFLPAITANQQIADGAVAALAPVLKQMFRAAGEGIFTDKDQELLLAMIPTRTDREAARSAKLRNVDAIVRAKLNISTQQPVEQPVQGVTPAQQTQTFNSTSLGREVSEQDIQDTLNANPGLTREQLFQQLGIQ